MQHGMSQPPVRLFSWYLVLDWSFWWLWYPWPLTSVAEPIRGIARDPCKSSKSP